MTLCVLRWVCAGSVREKWVQSEVLSLLARRIQRVDWSRQRSKADYALWLGLTPTCATGASPSSANKEKKDLKYVALPRRTDSNMTRDTCDEDKAVCEVCSADGDGAYLEARSDSVTAPMI